MKGGSILPILEHDQCLALLPCMKNAINLEVYLDENDEASGSIYIDDGESLDYLNNDSTYAQVDISISGGTLKSQLVAGSDKIFGADQKVTMMTIYGFHSSPLTVLAGAIETPFIYNPENEALMISLSDLPQDLDNVWIEVVWN